jgi:hypothetical protein
MRAAQIINGVVVNVVVVDSLDDFPELVDISDEFSIGDLYADGVFSKPVVIAPVPVSVTRRQMKLALLQQDLLIAVEDAVAASNDMALRINWMDALDFRRDNPFVSQMAGLLGKSDDDLDQIFTLAASL